MIVEIETRTPSRELHCNKFGCLYAYDMDGFLRILRIAMSSCLLICFVGCHTPQKYKILKILPDKPIQPGDLLHVTMTSPGPREPHFLLWKVNSDGNVDVPGISGKWPVSGKTLVELGKELSDKLSGWRSYNVTILRVKIVWTTNHYESAAPYPDGGISF
jgi:Polysaccharide biosynthesis/export protein